VHPYLIHIYLGPHESNSQTASRSVEPFLHGLPQPVPILYNGPPRPLKLPILWASGPHLTRSLGPTRVLNPNGISIGSAVFFTGLTTVTDRPTDHATRVYNNRPRPYVRSTAMRSKNVLSASTRLLLPFAIIISVEYVQTGGMRAKPAKQCAPPVLARWPLR